MKKIPTINYIKVFILFFVTVLVVLILGSNYKRRAQYERANQDVMSFLPIIRYEELSNYLVENHDGFIYMASSSDESLETFEESLKNYILTQEIEKYFVYLDNSGYSSIMYTDLENSFFSSDLSQQVVLSNQPNILAIKDGEIVGVLYYEPTNISLDDVKNFLSMYEVVEWFT